MGFFSRLFKKRTQGIECENQQIQTPSPKADHAQQLESGLALELLFPQAFEFTAVTLQAKLAQFLRTQSPPLLQGEQNCVVTLDPQLQAVGKILGTITFFSQDQWHTIELAGFDKPMPPAVIATCVDTALYKQADKQLAREHATHLILLYKGKDVPPLHQYHALLTAATVFKHFSAHTLVNETAHTSIPLALIHQLFKDQTAFETLNQGLLLYLYCGFTKYDIKGTRGIWMRTFGADKLGLPNLAFLATDHTMATSVFDLFENTLRYLLKTNTPFNAGECVQMAEGVYLNILLPESTHYFLDDTVKILQLIEK